jgi:hypothetical protein
MKTYKYHIHVSEGKPIELDELDRLGSQGMKLAASLVTVTFLGLAAYKNGICGGNAERTDYVYYFIILETES